MAALAECPCASTVYRAVALDRSYSTYRQAPVTFRMTANWPTYDVPGLTIVFTITVPFGKRFPTLRLLT